MIYEETMLAAQSKCLEYLDNPLLFKYSTYFETYKENELYIDLNPLTKLYFKLSFKEGESVHVIVAKLINNVQTNGSSLVFTGTYAKTITDKVRLLIEEHKQNIKIESAQIFIDTLTQTSITI